MLSTEETRRMAVLDDITKKISAVSLTDIASKLCIDRNDFERIKKKENPTAELVLAITINFWQLIFEFLNLPSVCEDYEEICNIDKVLQIIVGNTKHDDDNEKSKVDVLGEIANRLGEWRMFARILGHQESYINEVDRNYPSPDSYSQRNLEIMKHLSSKTSWEFWRQYLNQFDNGRELISEIEEAFPILLSEVDAGAHQFSNDDFNYCGHPFQYKHWESFNTSHENTDIAVRLDKDNEIVDYQSLSDWIDTQQQYSDRYTVLREINSFNFVNIGNIESPILNTLTKYLNNTNDTGFVVKGYHFVDHISLFKPGLFAKEIYDDHYFCFIVSDSVVLYITSSSQGKGHALHHSTQNIQIANLLHKELNSREILQINVIVHNNVENNEFCKLCVYHQLYVTEEVFQDTEKFLKWYQNVLHMMKLRRKSQQSKLKGNINDICQSIKKDMFTYEALENTALPSFSYDPEDQVDELQKIIVLTPPQVKVLYSNENHIIVRGFYGCGKSIVLEKRFEKIIENIDQDVSYLICHDQQSEYYHHLKSIQAKYPEKNIIVCQSKQLVQSVMIPKLSTILTNVKLTWPNKNVHLFIDEFSGSYFDKAEVLKLKQTLNMFQNSHIVVSLQPMEENVTKNETRESVDVGYQFEDLSENTSFVVYNLQHSLRCSYEINEFVKATAKIVESCSTSVEKIETFHSGGMFVDKEFGMENFQSKEEENYFYNMFKSKGVMKRSYKYNQSDSASHTVKSGPVEVYFLDKDKLSKSVGKTSIYLSILSHILKEASAMDKYVVCTYSNILYNSIINFLENNYSNSTNKISEFINPNSQCEILLTDYASVRGFEFPNFVFVAPLGSKFLRYRFAECLTRGTTKLFLITDNFNMAKKLFSKKSGYEVDLRLLTKWRESECSIFYDVRYDKSKDVAKAIENEEKEVILKEDVSKICFNSSDTDRFPWMDGVSLANTGNENDGVLGVIKNLLPDDQVNLCEEFLSSNKISFTSFSNEWKAKLLKLTIMHEAMHILKLFVDKYDFNIDRVDESQLSLLETAITYKNTDAIEFLLKKHSESTPHQFLSTLYGHQNVIKILTNKSSDINTQNSVGNTALFYAACDGYMDLVVLFIAMGATINVKNKNRDTPLHGAVAYNRKDIVRFLRRKKANTRVSNINGNTPIHLAATHGYIDIVSELLTKDEDCNIQGKHKNTPLHLAVINGHADVVKLLVSKQAISSVNSYKKTPLDYAADYGHLDIVKLLIDRITDVGKLNTPLHSAVVKGHYDIVKLLIDKHTNLGASTSHLTLLNDAVANGRVDITKLLIDENIDLNSQNDDGNTPLFIAISCHQLEIAKLLIDKNVSINIHNNNLESPFSIAVTNNHVDLVKLMMEKNVDYNLLNMEGNTPFLSAVAHGHAEIVKLLIDKDINVKTENKKGETPLYSSIINGFTDVVKLLIDRYTDISSQTKNGNTLLHAAVWYNHVDIVKLLLEKSADVNRQGSEGNTPLHDAVMKSYVDIVKVLIDYNADVSVKNNNGESPFDIALSKNHLNILEILKPQQ